MKKIIILLAISAVVLIGQEENQTQSIELPDFVITGKESISIPKIQKSYPEFIPLLSKDFFTPQYPNEEQTTIKLPEIETELVNIGSYKQKTNALLKFSAGLESWPVGEFYYNDWTDNFSYNAHLFGRNELEYVNKAGLSLAGVSLGGKYFVDQEANFLPGLEIDLNGKYYYESFHFYGSSTPNLKRSTNNGILNLGFNYTSDPYNNFGILFSDSYYEQKDDEIDENIFSTSAYMKFINNKFDFNLEGTFKNQTLSGSNSSFDNQYYVNSMLTVGFKFYNMLNLKVGAYLSESEGNTFFAPVAYASMKLHKNLSVFGEFAPNTEFQTLQDFRTANRYYRISNFANAYIENKFNLKVAAKFEYEKYFEISAGLGYINSDNNYYFEDNADVGFFNIYKQDIENSYAIVNLLFRKGPMGQLYGDAKFQKITGENNKNLPYNSTFVSSLNYLFDWDFGFGLNLGLNYYNESYSDYENQEKIPESFNVNANFYYEMFNNFKVTLAFENLLDDKYYYFRNYQAKPFDVLAGFEFRW